MIPKIVIFNASSLDARLDFINPDLGQYYQIASTIKEDATLVGSKTMLDAPVEKCEETQEVFEKPKQDLTDKRPILVIVDSKGLVRNWHVMKTAGYWKDYVAFCSKKTPKEYLQYLEKRHISFIIKGENKVDIKKALEELNKKYNIKKIRVDSGGTLNGILLRNKLVDEINILIQPNLIGGTTPKTFFKAQDLTSDKEKINLKLIKTETLANDVIWIQYKIKK
jgi:2,5-diamino-6-(ribosylamino)-4(3H)-pyrimidinone 5'-phosphate reductase